MLNVCTNDEEETTTTNDDERQDNVQRSFSTRNYTEPGIINDATSFSEIFLLVRRIVREHNHRFCLNAKTATIVHTTSSF